MTGIGEAPFPITTGNPEVQAYFNEGNALLHSFWFEEAERSFRWCLKLDPDCAMAYWGLARCGFTWFDRFSKTLPERNFGRYFKFLSEAVKRKASVSDRERMYIEAWEQGYAAGPLEHRERVIQQKIEAIAVKYPDDIEAKALLALFNIGLGSALANQKLIDDVLAKNPMHPGAHHASIHNWDGAYGAEALLSCAAYGKAAPNVGHARHMPGHVYSKVGMWHEAAISMDSATRTELKYMNDRLALPFETWNFSHNRNYLCYIQEQLGMADAALQGARDLIAAPRDPDYNSVNNGTAVEGIDALARGLIKFERWDEILKPGAIAWPKVEDTETLKPMAEALAHAGKHEPQAAEKSLAELEKNLARDKGLVDFLSTFVDATRAEVALSAGDKAKARELLTKAATEEQKQRDAGRYVNDPPFQPWPIYRLLGDLDMAENRPYLAIDHYEKALRSEANDAFSLAGLAQAYARLGDKPKAARYAGRFDAVWSGSDPQLKWSQAVKALNLGEQPVSEVPEAERPYIPAQLDGFGPSNWQPFAAPKLDVTDASGKHVSLADYQGKNVILVFYLGASCVHCVQQLDTINGRFRDLDKENTVVLAVSSTVQDPKKLNDSHIELLSDQSHENARRFASYDDFEDMELHSTILIDSQGRVRWKRTGGDPFANVDFLIGEISRINHEQQAATRH